ncbi:MAG: ABC transporter permease [Pirellulales bacterium]
MRPYLAVLIDSFNEALASRVLWILIVLSTLFLLALAPLGISEQRATGFSRTGISALTFPSLADNLKKQLAQEGPSVGKRIAEISDDQFTTRINEFVYKESNFPQNQSLKATITKAFDTAVKDKDFYQEAAWANIKLPKEAQELLDQDSTQLSDEDLQYRNRLLLGAAFKYELNLMTDVQNRLTYFTWEISTPLEIPRKIIDEGIKQALSAIMSILVGVIAVFVGILVTAPIIPRTFEAGAIDLLLSKPVSRSFLFLTKFFGGCAFVLLNAGFFIVGLWLIMGLRFGIWHPQLLLCIPIFLFLFAIYYSVSAWAGVVWKNSIVCIVVSILFWAACFAVGSTKDVLEQFLLNPQQIVKIVNTNDSVMAVTQSGKFVQWEEDLNDWGTIFSSNSNQRRGGPPIAFGKVFIGPVYDSQTNELIYIEKKNRSGQFSFSGGGNDLSIASWKGTWQKTKGATPPAGTSWIFLDDQGTLTTVDMNGVSKLDAKNRTGATSAKFMGFDLRFGGKTLYEPLGPDSIIGIMPPFSAAMDKQTGEIVVYNRDRLYLLTPGSDGKYVEESSFHFEDAEGPTALAIGGKHIVIAFSDGKVLQIDKNNLASGTGKEYHPAGKSEPYLAACSKDGNHFGILFHNGTMWTLNGQSNQTDYIRGDNSAFAFVDDEIWVADRITRITRYGLDDNRQTGEYNPSPDTLLSIYWYGVKPLYTIFPKPRELGNVVNYLITDKETQALGPETNDLQSVRVSVDIWSPIINSTIFIMIMLGITCIYIERNDM